jgi:threonine aldolase
MKKIFESKLQGSPRLSPHQWFSTMAQDTKDKNIDFDFYGSGQVIEDFEDKIANTLGTQSAVFMPSGTMAQQIALKVCSKPDHRIAFHPLSHLEIHEQMGYKELHNIEAVLIGDTNNYLTLDMIKKTKEKLSCILYELPQREIGGILPSWDELVSISNYCHENNIHFHMDGARLWEVGPYYDKSYEEICSLFDSIYVSFYKGLNGIAGAVLAGETSFINDSKIWLRRHGGNLIHLYPYVISCDIALKKNLSKMKPYFLKTKEIAKILNTSTKMETFPLVPQSNMVHVLFLEDKEIVNKKLIEINKKYKTFLFHNSSENQYLNSIFKSKAELHIGDHSLEYPLDLLTKILKEYF